MTLLLCAPATMGCGGDDEVSLSPLPAVSYVGEVEGSDARIAVVADGAEVVVYLCGGPASYTTFTRWFRAAVPDSPPEFHIENDGLAVRGSLRGALAEGVLDVPGGTRLAWGAQATHGDAIAGLYSAHDEGCATGVIVAPAAPGEQPHVQGTWCSSSGARAQVIPLFPVQLQSTGRLEVSVVVDGTTRHLLVAPVGSQAP